MPEAVRGGKGGRVDRRMQAADRKKLSADKLSDKDDLMMSEMR